jgi:hypothetical protein
MPYNVHFRDGKLITSNGNGVYKVENGQKRAFPSGAVFSSYGYKWSDVITISNPEMADIPDGAVMTAK